MFKRARQRPGPQEIGQGTRKLCLLQKQVFCDCLPHVFKLHFFLFNLSTTATGIEGGELGVECGCGEESGGGHFPLLFFIPSSAAVLTLPDVIPVKCKCHDLIRSAHGEL